MEIEYNDDGNDNEETDSRSLGSTDTWSSTEECDLDTYQFILFDEEEEEVGDDSDWEELNISWHQTRQKHVKYSC